MAKPKGIPLPDNIKAKMEFAFSTDFSNVRIFICNLPRLVKARAFTYGSHIFILPEYYKPECFTGQILLGHELAHVVQQRNGRAKKSMVKNNSHVLVNYLLETQANVCGILAALKLPALLSDSNLSIGSPVIQCVRRRKDFFSFGLGNVIDYMKSFFNPADNANNGMDVDEQLDNIFDFDNDENLLGMTGIKQETISGLEILTVLDEVIEAQIAKVRKEPKKEPDSYYTDPVKSKKLPVYRMTNFTDWLKTYKNFTGFGRTNSDKDYSGKWYPCYLEIAATGQKVLINSSGRGGEALVFSENIAPSWPALGRAGHTLVEKLGNKGNERLAQAILDALHGKDNALFKNEAVAKYVSEFLALAFAVESSRDRLSFLTSYICLDLIAKGCTYGVTNKKITFLNLCDSVYLDKAGNWRQKPHKPDQEVYRPTAIKKHGVEAVYQPVATRLSSAPVKKSSRSKKRGASALSKKPDSIKGFLNFPLLRRGTKSDADEPILATNKKKRKKISGSAYGGKFSGSSARSGTGNYSEMGILLGRDTSKYSEELKEMLKQQLMLEFENDDYIIRHNFVVRASSAAIHWLELNDFFDDLTEDKASLLSAIRVRFADIFAGLLATVDNQDEATMSLFNFEDEDEELSLSFFEEQLDQTDDNITQKGDEYQLQSHDINFIAMHVLKKYDNKVVFASVQRDRQLAADDSSSLQRSLREEEGDIQQALNNNQSVVSAFNANNNHWVAFKIIPKNNEDPKRLIVLYKDSFGDAPSEVFTEAFDALKENGYTVEFQVSESCEQRKANDQGFKGDSVNCGLFAIKNMEAFAQKESEEIEEYDFHFKGITDELSDEVYLKSLSELRAGHKENYIEQSKLIEQEAEKRREALEDSQTELADPIKAILLKLLPALNKANNINIDLVDNLSVNIGTIQGDISKLLTKISFTKSMAEQYAAVFMKLLKSLGIKYQDYEDNKYIVVQVDIKDTPLLLERLQEQAKKLNIDLTSATSAPKPNAANTILPKQIQVTTRKKTLGVRIRKRGNFPLDQTDDNITQKGDEYQLQSHDINFIAMHVLKKYDNKVVFASVQRDRQLAADDSSSLQRSLREEEGDIQQALNNNQSVVSAFNANNNHWVAFKIIPKNNEDPKRLIVLYKDSFGDAPSEVFTEAFDALKENGYTVEFQVSESCEQRKANDQGFKGDSVNCGLFAIKNMEAFAQKESEEIEEYDFHFKGITDELSDEVYLKSLSELRAGHKENYIEQSKLIEQEAEKRREALEDSQTELADPIKAILLKLLPALNKANNINIDLVDNLSVNIGTIQGDISKLLTKISFTKSMAEQYAAVFMKLLKSLGIKYQDYEDNKYIVVQVDIKDTPLLLESLREQAKVLKLDLASVMSVAVAIPLKHHPIAPPVSAPQQAPKSVQKDFDTKISINEILCT